ncbi:UDP-N-acetylmuramoyl-L-alanyl-D-glutamate--2,6-diaminopimelate ligase [Aestuariivirga litoralis]|uniref:UDP-N-acetylmuramoyl-L-alanyl-D-glutamate--2, 6-diaminopimelate ligase n=1 Tax=Aestuariivirga litoralis TaxID=2650924 RepID=UPI0018C480A0|nr:UDP-N-acetylmuramoyl-L-alanyl-D-glutamate--2,6-diaminopimelate ligase [Aestuariivirga litoralis]MBG1231960.1 UDP-N-acetylmuramoyl-L-alanyl-D-glutamate--2,6-diaminopimelate ligase [Aestuariivirga litoralis]
MGIPLSRLLKGDAPLPKGGDLAISGLTADSREVKPGFLFAGLPGTKANGATFIDKAFAAGAVAAIAQSGSYTGSNPVIAVDNPRRLLALVASRFYDRQPETIVAVTGTNGKTSVSVFVRQIWATMGFRAASLGTIGVVGPEGAKYLAHTTPDPIQLAALAAELRDDGVKHLAIEASSHGLEQNRLDGLVIAAGAFTNLTRDHLDYHGTFENYFAAKLRLFDTLLPQGAGAVINMDSPQGEEVLAHVKRAGLVPFRVGNKGVELRLVDLKSSGLTQLLTVEYGGQTYQLDLPLAGDFQVSNALVAAGLVIAAGGEAHLALHALESLKGAKGRLELVGIKPTGGNIFVDYAHTPDALETALSALRPSTQKRLIVVFGCGGDRDKGKRPLMAAACARLADHVIVTDDNPRSEDPATIRREALAGAPGAQEIGDRAKAIRTGVEMLQEGDVLLVAGKGHEEGQTVGNKVLPFIDHDAVAAALRGEDYHG